MGRRWDTAAKNRKLAFDNGLIKPRKLTTITVGASVELHDVEDFCMSWGITRTKDGKPPSAENPPIPAPILGVKVLRAMGVPVIAWPNGHLYFNVAALELAFTNLTHFGGTGFVTPGSFAGKDGFRHATSFAGIPKELDPKQLQKNAKPTLEAALAVATLRRGKVSEATKKKLLAAHAKLSKAVDKLLPKKELDDDAEPASSDNQPTPAAESAPDRGSSGSPV